MGKYPTLRNLLVCLLVAWICGTAALAEVDVRSPTWAGRFYPADPKALRDMLDVLHNQAASTKLPNLPAGRLQALVLPHAGYIYSGLTAAHGLKVLEGLSFEKVVLVGPDHRVGFANGAVSTADFWQTPLGRVSIHPDAVYLERRSELFQVVPASERQEHSLEVLVPYLQYALQDFQLLPIVLGRPTRIARMADTIGDLVDDKTLLVVSSDLSHFLSDERARRQDADTLELIMDLRPQKLLQKENCACGKVPLAVLMTVATARQWKPILLHYSTSADTAGSSERVVGYAAVAFYGEDRMKPSGKQTNALSPAQGQLLVRLARQTIAERLNDKPADGHLAAAVAREPAFQQRSGTFVTLKKHDRLRGCIGSLAATETLAEGVRRNALNAAFNDYRFTPLTPEELAEVDIEVSVLTQPQPLAYRDADDLLGKLRPHVDGLIIRKGHRSATFLPQVWEQLPRTEDFLSHLCSKAGLSADAWRRGDLEVQTYRVIYFEEGQ